MKILAPLRSADEVLPLAQAGAGEFYCGVTPPGWEAAFGQASVHRRSARSAGVSGLVELRQIVALAGDAPVFATLNAPSYPAGAIPRLVEFGRMLVEEANVAALIVAELELMLALGDAGLAGRVHVSSLATCRNPGAAAFYRSLGVSRVILPRHMTLAEIEQTAIPGLEWEAFLLNDGCAFEEGTCSTTHAFRPYCIDDQVGQAQGRLDERYAFWKWTLNNCGCQTSRGYTLGPCGLCALARLERAGVESLKVVGREAPLARKLGSVRLASIALRLAERGAAREAIRDAVVAERGAPELCESAHLCYYPDVWADTLPKPRQAQATSTRKAPGRSPAAAAAPTRRVVPIHAEAPAPSTATRSGSC
ncbi:MAG: U32 family peptidase [Betaproteobacteria bacterium]|nr:U32 family peptidase [Betaproteobacteria bacterium]